MDTGDVIRYQPTGEKYVLARVSNNLLVCFGAPIKWFSAINCDKQPASKVSEEQRCTLLAKMATKDVYKEFRQYALERLAAMNMEEAEQVLPKEF